VKAPARTRFPLSRTWLTRRTRPLAATPVCQRRRAPHGGLGHPPKRSSPPLLPTSPHCDCLGLPHWPGRPGVPFTLGFPHEDHWRLDRIPYSNLVVSNNLHLSELAQLAFQQAYGRPPVTSPRTTPGLSSSTQPTNHGIAWSTPPLGSYETQRSLPHIGPAAPARLQPLPGPPDPPPGP
jgi:hypothetical protein